MTEEEKRNLKSVLREGTEVHTLKASSTSLAVSHSVMLWIFTAVPKNSSICR